MKSNLAKNGVRIASVAVLIALAVFFAYSLNLGRVREDYGAAVANLAPISIELADAPAGASPELRVQSWIRKNRSAIVAAARDYGVDCRAIAGVIAFEALADPMWTTLGGTARWSGPGKVHFKEYYGAEGNPVARQVEAAGYLPRRTMDKRRAILSTTAGSIRYIAAILRALSDASQLGESTHNIPMSVGMYASWTLKDALANRGDRAAFRRGPAHTLAASWIKKHFAYIARSTGDCGPRLP